MLTLVVARYEEDVSWINLVHANVAIVDKAQVGNSGREAASYLWFIVNHYESLRGEYLFCQGDPYPHCPDFDQRVAAGAREFGTRFTCDWTGAPHHPGLDLRGLAGRMMVDLPAAIEFTAGAQFVRSAEEIGKRPPWFYERALFHAEHYLDAAWCFERLWDYLIPRI